MSLIYKDIDYGDIGGLPAKCGACPKVTDVISKSKGFSLAKILIAEGEVVGIAICSLRTGRFGRRLISPDSVFLSCLHIFNGHRGKGFGKMILNRMEKEIIALDFKAVESIASKRAESGIPFDFLIQNGFYIKKKDPLSPLLRLDLDSIAREIDLEKVARNFPMLPKPAIDKVLAQKI